MERPFLDSTVPVGTAALGCLAERGKSAGRHDSCGADTLVRCLWLWFWPFATGDTQPRGRNLAMAVPATCRSPKPPAHVPS